MPGQIKRVDRIRKYLDERIKDIEPGTIIFTDALSTGFDKFHHTVSNVAIGLALRERSDVKRVRDGVWMKR